MKHTGNPDLVEELRRGLSPEPPPSWRDGGGATSPGRATPSTVSSASYYDLVLGFRQVRPYRDGSRDPKGNGLLTNPP